ncbi:ClpXP protease specificity-enhancing factor [Enterovibrio norvegicus FF-33]|uniref:Stringent starvation protein B n=1 Tax=Enterovibrio norvegicus FF-454 TaxID=1185651 RepID=A0A1E5BXK9_9GAMM|nr:ClpXP protease specificity-enhancing factor [Enterovibrio norvegicus]OEE57930.1 ClpXP protease specificity-enhancing factor [Enterovibrio norvegicus FF-454]OEE70569.1 ClpXP protease specificity-enhancing factor [Enterovibrio norvegicus FF-33]OEE90434.1 ClpXP protease specificity-enhancing factor [Enterovibrio norvegicus FF-162]
MDDATLKPRRPYLLRAFYDWLIDNDLTPHLVVDATLPYVNVPTEYVQDGQIVLNVAPRAIGNLDLGNDEVCFNARFGGRPMLVSVPLYAVLAIYARENGAGTMFDPEPAYEAELERIELEPEVEPKDTDISVISGNVASDDDTSVDAESDNKFKGRPTLTVVK